MKIAEGEESNKIDVDDIFHILEAKEEIIDELTKKSDNTPSAAYEEQKLDGCSKKLSESQMRDYEHENLVPALLSLQLLFNENIKDFHLDLDPSKYQKCDNLVITITYSDGKKDEFTLQLKHRENEKDKFDEHEELFIPEYHEFYARNGQKSATETRKSIEDIFVKKFFSTREAATCYIDFFRNVRNGDYDDTKINRYQIVLNIIKLLLSDYIIRCRFQKQVNDKIELVEKIIKRFDWTVLSSTKKRFISENWIYKASLLDPETRSEMTKWARNSKLLRKDLEEDPEESVLQFAFHIKNELLFLHLNESSQRIISSAASISKTLELSVVLVGEDIDGHFEEFRTFRHLEDLQQFNELYQNVIKLMYGQEPQTVQNLKKNVVTADEIFRFLKNDILTGSFEEHLSYDNFLKILPRNRSNFSQAYKHFVNAKLTHYLKKETGSNFNKHLEEIIRNFYWRGYQHAALATCLEDDLFKSLKNVEIDRNFLRNDALSDLLKVSEDEFLFGDQTLADFFAATWLVENIHQVPEERKSFLFQAKYSEIRRFFDYELAEDHPLHLAVLDTNVSAVKREAPKLLFDQDEGGRTALHLAVSLGKKHDFCHTKPVVPNFEQEEILKILLEEWKLRSTVLPGKDKIFAWNLFEYADASLCLFSLKELSKIQDCPWRNLNTFSQEEFSLSYHCVANGYINLLQSISLEKSLQDLDSLHEESLLHLALQKNQEEVAVQLLLRGVNGRRRDHEARTALHLAATYGHEAAAILLSKPCLNDKDNCGKTALHHASRKGHLTIVKLLVQEGADINSVDNDHKTPLHEAAGAGYSDIVEYLVMKQARKEIKDKNDKTALDYARGRQDIEEVLTTEATKQRRTCSWTPGTIHDAVRKEDLDLLKKLLKKGHHIDETDKKGETVLHIAAANGNIKIVKFLLKNSANPAAKNLHGCVPLHLAAENGQVEVVEILLTKAESTAVDGKGNTPVHLAIYKGHSDIIKVFANSGVDFDRVILNNMTLLHIAVQYGQNEIVELLLSRGADVTKKTKEGKTCLHLAADRRHSDIVELLTKPCKNVIDEVDAAGNTALHLAVASRTGTRAVKALLEAKANVYVRNKINQTARDVAVLMNQEDIVDCFNNFSNM